MIFCRKEKWVHERNRSHRHYKVFAWLPKKVGSDCWVWLEHVVCYQQVWGWGFHDKWYELEEMAAGT